MGAKLEEHKEMVPTPSAQERETERESSTSNQKNGR